MSKFIINGGNKLEGEVNVEGSKNAVLPILAASLINGDESIIHNIPRLKDVSTLTNVLENIGCRVFFNGNTIVVNSKGELDTNIPERPVKEMRSSIILMGAVLGRFKHVKISYPGGCEIGPRPIDLHLKGLRKLGVNITESHGYIVCQYDKLIGKEIHLDYPSVGATEINIMLAATRAKGQTIIENAAREPEIIDLQNFLNKIGADIVGAGSSTIKISGTGRFHSAEHTVIPDRIVAGTYLIAAAITGGEIVLQDIVLDHLKPLISKLTESGCKIEKYDKMLMIKSPKRLNAVEMIKTLPYPGFPTDMQAQFMSLMSIAKGTSVIVETVFENRYKHAEELIKMGAKIKLDGRTAIVRGVRKLTGAQLAAKDLRGGAALVLAALSAEGVSNIDNIDNHIERGYEDFDVKLKSLGADIMKVII